MSDAVLRFVGASVGYHAKPVLRDVDLQLSAGGTLALVGPNGAGKSTLIKAVVGSARVLTGTATVLGTPVGKARGRAGYVPQLDTLEADFPVTALQVVLMGRYRRIGWWRPTGSADRRAAREALDRVGLADRAGHGFGTLSGGQRQRVLLARALAADPRLLLLDEPFNGVDAVSRQAIIAVLRQLTAAGAGLVFSTHDLTVARDLADQVCLLNGRQFAVGTPGETLAAGPLSRAYGGEVAP